MEAMKYQISERESKVQERGLRNRFKGDEEGMEIDQVSFEGGSLSGSIGSNMNSDDKDSIKSESLNADEQLMLDTIQQDHFTTNPKNEVEGLGLDNNQSNVTNANKITLNLQSGYDDSQLAPKLQEIPEFYKHATPLTISELEWTVTLSRYDFPWNEISFGQFTAKDCYKMYRS